jgi:hypothetical protein
MNVRKLEIYRIYNNGDLIDGLEKADNSPFVISCPF